MSLIIVESLDIPALSQQLLISSPDEAAADFSGMIPDPTGTTAIATNAGYAKLFAELGAGSLVVGIKLVVLILFLRKLITDKAETPLTETPVTVVPVA
jgi:hypothetical protein